MLPFMAFFMYRFNKKLKDGHKESRRKVGELNATIEDSLLGIHVVKSFAGEEKEIEKFAEGNKGFFNIRPLNLPINLGAGNLHRGLFFL